jgi:hypothetical protein
MFGMTEILFYGIDETGQAAYCERLGTPERSALDALARERLVDWPAVEIWHGPCCVVRMQQADDRRRKGSIGGLGR